MSISHWLHGVYLPGLGVFSCLRRGQAAVSCYQWILTAAGDRYTGEQKLMCFDHLLTGTSLGTLHMWSCVIFLNLLYPYSINKLNEAHIYSMFCIWWPQPKFMFCYLFKAICVKNIVNMLRIYSQHIIKDTSVIENLKSVDSMSASSVFKWFFPKFIHRSLSSNKLTCQHIETVFYVVSCKIAQSLQKENQMVPHTSGTLSLTAGCSLSQSHDDLFRTSRGIHISQLK